MQRGSTVSACQKVIASMHEKVITSAHEKVIASVNEKAITSVDPVGTNDQCREDQQSTFTWKIQKI